MATRETAASAKEKRGISPSSSRSNVPRRKPGSPDRKHAPVTVASSEKHVPNYLKPTISSGLDPSKHAAAGTAGKKQVSCDTTTNKPSLTRRRSFDKPPSPSQVQRTRVSPNPPKESSLRSSSFSAKSSIVPKPLPDKLLKTPKDSGKTRSLYGGNINIVKKSSPSTSSSTSSKKQEAADETTSVDINVEIVLQQQQEDRQSSVTEADVEATNVEINSEPEAEVLASESLQHTSQIHEELKTIDTNIEGPEKKAEVEDSGSSSPEEKQEENQNRNTCPDESVPIEPEVDKGHASDENVEEQKVMEEKEEEKVEEKVMDEKEEEEQEQEEVKASDDKEEKIEEVIALADEVDASGEKEEKVEGKEADEKEEVTDGSTTLKSDEMGLGDSSKGVKQQTNNAAPKNQQSSAHQVKKDSAVSNDVIEETASKLREQRKNKVKALAGAFETVISLQEPRS